MKVVTENKIVIEGGDYIGDIAFKAYQLARDFHRQEFVFNGIKFIVEKAEKEDTGDKDVTDETLFF
jgi:hypothetical protein